MGPRLGHNRFIQMAEESYLPAFQSIQNIVHAFGSVSMMVNIKVKLCRDQCDIPQ